MKPMLREETHENIVRLQAILTALWPCASPNPMPRVSTSITTIEDGAGARMCEVLHFGHLRAYPAILGYPMKHYGWQIDELIPGTADDMPEIASVRGEISVQSCAIELIGMMVKRDLSETITLLRLAKAIMYLAWPLLSP